MTDPEDITFAAAAPEDTSRHAEARRLGKNSNFERIGRKIKTSIREWL